MTDIAPPAPAPWPVDLGALRDFLATIGSAVGPEFILSPDRQLYHYTNLDGFAGILRGDDLWLTHSRYSNDEEEITHGQEIVQAVLDEAMRDPAREPYVARVKALMAHRAQQGIYVCCFCAKDDLLSQWRAYGANGTGVSIEIASWGFEAVTGADSPNGLLRLWKVSYKTEQQQQIIHNALDFFYSYANALDLETKAMRAVDALHFFIPTFKNASFAEEAEWRLIFTPNPVIPAKLKFRVGRGLLVPYYTLREVSGPAAPPTLLAVEGVTVGPSANKQLNVESARSLLAEVGRPGTPVRASETPYRG